MTWPDVERVDGPQTTGERRMLEDFLEWQRATLLHKCAGLTPEQLARQAVPPSTMSLLGLVRHLAEVEQGWFCGGWRPEVTAPLWDRTRDDAFDAVDPRAADADLELYRRHVGLAREEAARHDLDETTRAPWRADDVSLRWIYIHMIEEYARHNGHADLLREQLDGTVGE